MNGLSALRMLLVGAKSSSSISNSTRFGQRSGQYAMGIFAMEQKCSHGGCCPRHLSTEAPTSTQAAPVTPPASGDSSIQQQEPQQRAPRQFRSNEPKVAPTQWTCDSCGSQNEPWAAVCQTCQAPKTGLMARRGDFVCLECGHHNYAIRDSCRSCGAIRAPASGPAATPRVRTSFGGADRGSQMQSSGYGGERRQTGSTKHFIGAESGKDWKCPGCAARVFAPRTECFRCSTPIPENPEYITEPRPAPRFARFGGDGEQQVEGNQGERREFRPRRNSFGSDGGAAARPPRERRPTDWDCPSCGDLNFGYRNECRKCNTPKP